MATKFDDFDVEAYREYKDEIIISQGFHVLSDYGRQSLGGIFRVEEGSKAFQKAVAAAKFAVEKYNETENTNLKFVKVLSVNEEPSVAAIYYITLEASGPSDDFKQYHAKVWYTISNKFHLTSFSVAPYAPTGTIENGSCMVLITNLQPWMDENYLYYKCFHTAKELLEINVVRNKSEGIGFLRFKSRAAGEEVLAAYDLKLMPSTSQVYSFCFYGAI